MSVEIPQGQYETSVSVPDVNSFFVFSDTHPIYGSSISSKNKKVKTNFASRLNIWAWKTSEFDSTKIYLEARPVNSNVVSCNGCSIGHSWWKQANGYAEYKLVKNYSLLLEELKRNKEISEKIMKNYKPDKKKDYL